VVYPHLEDNNLPAIPAVTSGQTFSMQPDTTSYANDAFGEKASDFIGAIPNAGKNTLCKPDEI
jgi:hypothetical protein